MAEIPFYLIASITIASAYWVVVSSRLIYSAIALLLDANLAIKYTLYEEQT